MGFFTVVGVSTAIMNCLMTFITLQAGKKTINIIWAFFCFSVAILGYCLTMVSFSRDPDTALFWWRASYLGVTNLPILILHTTLLMLGEFRGKKVWIIIAGYTLTIIFHILNFSGLLIQHVSIVYNEIYFDTPYTPYFFGFSLFFNAVFIAIFILLYFAYKRSKQKEESRRIIFFSLGIGVGVFGGGALFLPVYGIDIYPYTAILTGAYPVIIGYSILRHHLFDARSAILQILRIVTIVVISLFIGSIFWYGLIWIGYTPSFYPIETFLGMVVLGSVFLLNRSRKLTDAFLLSSLAELERQTEKFLDKKGVYKNTIDLLKDLEEIFGHALKIKKVLIMSYEETAKYPKCLNYFHSYNKPLALSELQAEDVEGESHALVREVEDIGEVIFALDHGKKEGIYFLVLGKKESEHTITQDELRIINHILPKIALALQVLEYNRSLQEEVRIQTKELNLKNKELKVAYKKLQDVDQNKDNFLAIASHELRTPMTIIKGYSDLFLRDTFGSLSPDARSYMQKIYDNTESLIELVNNILDISKIEAGRFELLYEEVNIRELIQLSVENFETLYREKGIALILTNECQINTIRTDKSKFILICNNLLSNAYKFTDTGGKVEVHVTDGNNILTIQVKDTGKGIEPERIEHVFEKFNQMDNTNYTKKSIHGTGLGLHLCKQIIELLGGSIRAESTLGTGTTFLFSIPLHHVESAM